MHDDRTTVGLVAGQALTELAANQELVDFDFELQVIDPIDLGK
jgi:hypothetical protein